MKRLFVLFLCLFVLLSAVSGMATAEETYKSDVIVGIEGKLVTFDPQNSSIAPMNYVARMIFD